MLCAQTYRLDKGMPNVSPWTWASTGSFFAHLGVQGAGEALAACYTRRKQ